MEGKIMVLHKPMITKEGKQIMGAGHHKSSRELMYEYVNYSKPEVIQWLLRNYYSFKSSAYNDMNTELIGICLDVEKGLEVVNLTDRQKEALEHYMVGDTEEEIGKRMGGISHQAVHKLVMKVANKISEYLAKGEEE